MSIATTEPRTVPKTPARSRIGAVLQLHTVAWPLLIAWPVGILLISFLISFTIYAIVGNGEGEGFTGSVFSVYGFVLAFYLQSMTQTFPFALGLSVTRREFFTATTVMALAQSAIFAIALQLLSVVESATNGWGVHMRMFGIARYFTDNTAVQLLALFATLLLTSSIAMLAGAIYQRWRITGLLASLTGLFGLLGLFSDRDHLGWVVAGDRFVVCRYSPTGTDGATPSGPCHRVHRRSLGDVASSNAVTARSCATPHVASSRSARRIKPV